VIDHGTQTTLGEFVPETLHFFRVEGAELPASRVPGENLERVTFFLRCRVYCVVEGFSDGDMDSDSDRRLSLGWSAVVV
jgi:hypothetical protein